MIKFLSVRDNVHLPNPGQITPSGKKKLNKGLSFISNPAGVDIKDLGSLGEISEDASTSTVANVTLPK